MRRCPMCNERIKRKAQKCKHCLTVLSDNPEQLEYIGSCFDEIDSELEAFSAQIDETEGIFFVRHRFSQEDLENSRHLHRIEDLSQEIKGMIDTWSSSGMLSYRAGLEYNSRAAALHRQLDEIKAQIEARNPTFWEAICEFFERIVRFIKKIVVPFLCRNKTRIEAHLPKSRLTGLLCRLFPSPGQALG